MDTGSFSTISVLGSTQPRTWEPLHSGIPKIPDLTHDEREQLAIAHRELETRFRNRLFSPGHPLERTLSEPNAWTARTIMGFAGMLRRMEQSDGFEGSAKTV